MYTLPKQVTYLQHLCHKFDDTTFIAPARNQTSPLYCSVESAITHLPNYTAGTIRQDNVHLLRNFKSLEWNISFIKFQAIVMRNSEKRDINSYYSTKGNATIIIGTADSKVKL